MFSERYDAFLSIGEQPDFFVCHPRDERFGWNRADIVVAISDAEQRTISTALERSTAIALPYAEDMTAPDRQAYRHPDKVVFGFFGSAHPFNLHGLRALIAHLGEHARWAPIELVIAGEVGRALTTSERAMVTDLGYVRSPDDFYNAIDIFVSPLDFGSGLKIKVVEAISKGIPTLVTKHSAIGTGLHPRLVVENVASLAAAMSRIALGRPSLAVFGDVLADSQQALSAAVETGTRHLLDSISIKQRRAVLRLKELALPINDPKLWIAIGMLREIANHVPVAIDLGDDFAEPSWLRFLHPRIQLAGTPPAQLGAFGESRPRVSRARLSERLSLQIVVSNDPLYRLAGAGMHIHDARWDGSLAPDHATHELNSDGVLRSQVGDPIARHFPWCSDSLKWDPVLPKPSKIRTAPWIALIPPAGESAARRVLQDVLSLSATVPTKIFEREDGVAAGALLKRLRLDPPVLVVEFKPCDATGTIEEWCGIAGIAYLATLSANEAIQAVRQPPAALEAPPSTRWHEVLSRIFTTS